MSPSQETMEKANLSKLLIESHYQVSAPVQNPRPSNSVHSPADVRPLVTALLFSPVQKRAPGEIMLAALQHIPTPVSPNRNSST